MHQYSPSLKQIGELVDIAKVAAAVDVARPRCGTVGAFLYRHGSRHTNWILAAPVNQPSCCSFIITRRSFLFHVQCNSPLFKILPEESRTSIPPRIYWAPVEKVAEHACAPLPGFTDATK